MTKRLFTYNRPTRITYFMWCGHWRTSEHWVMGGVPLTFFSNISWKSSENVTMRAVCFGPLVILSGKFKEVQNDI